MDMSYRQRLLDGLIAEAQRQARPEPDPPPAQDAEAAKPESVDGPVI